MEDQKIIYYSMFLPRNPMTEELFGVQNEFDHHLKQIKRACHCDIREANHDTWCASALMIIEIVYDEFLGNHQECMNYLELFFKEKEMGIMSSLQFLPYQCIVKDVQGKYHTFSLPDSDIGLQTMSPEEKNASADGSPKLIAIGFQESIPTTAVPDLYINALQKCSKHKTVKENDGKDLQVNAEDKGLDSLIQLLYNDVSNCSNVHNWGSIPEIPVPCSTGLSSYDVQQMTQSHFLKDKTIRERYKLVDQQLTFDSSSTSYNDNISYAENSDDNSLGTDTHYSCSSTNNCNDYSRPTCKFVDVATLSSITKTDSLMSLNALFRQYRTENRNVTDADLIKIDFPLINQETENCCKLNKHDENKNIVPLNELFDEIECKIINYIIEDFIEILAEYNGEEDDAKEEFNRKVDDANEKGGKAKTISEVRHLE